MGIFRQLRLRKAVFWGAYTTFRQIGSRKSFAETFDVRVQGRPEFSNDLPELVGILLRDRSLTESANLIFHSMAHQ